MKQNPNDSEVNDNIMELVNLIQQKSQTKKISLSRDHLEKMGVAQKPFVIAIDGRGGSGKSTLARRLNQILSNSCIIQMDDFYKEHQNELNFDLDRLQTQALAPLKNGLTAIPFPLIVLPLVPVKNCFQIRI